MFIKVKVSVGAKKESIRKIGTDRFEIVVKEKAERNLANERVIKLISEYLGIGKGKIKIINGHQRLNKILEIKK